MFSIDAPLRTHCGGGNSVLTTSVHWNLFVLAVTCRRYEKIDRSNTPVWSHDADTLWHPNFSSAGANVVCSPHCQFKLSGTPASEKENQSLIYSSQVSVSCFFCFLSVCRKFTTLRNEMYWSLLSRCHEAQHWAQLHVVSGTVDHFLCLKGIFKGGEEGGFGKFNIIY